MDLPHLHAARCSWIWEVLLYGLENGCLEPRIGKVARGALLQGQHKPGRGGVQGGMMGAASGAAQNWKRGYRAACGALLQGQHKHGREGTGRHVGRCFRGNTNLGYVGGERVAGTADTNQPPL